MRISGEWYRCVDGEVRPIVHAEILSNIGVPISFKFLVDTGAQQTVLSKEAFDALGLPGQRPLEPVQSMGGIVPTDDVEATVFLAEDHVSKVKLQVRCGARKSTDALELSVLGRDITGFFAVITDRPGGVVCLVNQRHGYQITQA